MTRLVLSLAALLLGTTATAHEFTAGTLTIIHPAIPAPFAGARSAAGYLSIVNGGTEADRLIGASAGFADVTMLHESRTDADGVATMSHVPGIEIPAGASVTLERGGYHLMFMGLTQRLTEGDMLPATLTFETAGTVAVEFEVEPPGAEKDDHSQHGAASAPAARRPAAMAGETGTDRASAPLPAWLARSGGRALMGQGAAADAHGG
jgi:hypothetical protein